MKCCKKHGLPIKCLEQKLEANTEAEHNNTHMVITTIISKECHDYKSVLHGCKKECMNNGNLRGDQSNANGNLIPNGHGELYCIQFSIV